MAAFASLLISNILSIAAYPSFNPSKQYFSDFGIIKATSLAWNTGMFIFGVLAAAGLLLLLYAGNRNSLLFAIGMAAGIGFAILAAFNESAGSMHTTGALLAFAAGSIFTIGSYNTEKGPLLYVPVALGLISIISLIILIFSASFLGPGITELFIVVPFAIWLLIVGVKLAIFKSNNYE